MQVKSRVRERMKPRHKKKGKKRKERKRREEKRREKKRKKKREERDKKVLVSSKQCLRNLRQTFSAMMKKNKNSNIVITSHK